MFTENCKKIEPVVVKLYSKTKYITFFLNTVYMLNILQVVLDSVQPIHLVLPAGCLQSFSMMNCSRRAMVTEAGCTRHMPAYVSFASVQVVYYL